MPKSKATQELEIEDIYKSLTDHEHVLKRPDTYVGSMDLDTVNYDVYDEDTGRFETRLISYVGAFYKIFDEILVNARDNVIREVSCKTIKVNIDTNSGRITIWNDGKGLPVVIHKQHKIYVPELIFGTLRSGSNFDEGKIVGGKNGFGAKLTNIFSKEFVVETVDEERKKKYRQVFRNNMHDKEDPVIENINKGVKSYTMISFIPDFELFGLKKLTNDLSAFFKRRVFDIAAVTQLAKKAVTVYLNDEKIKTTDFQDYISLYYPSKPKDLVYSVFNSRWKVGVVFNPDSGFKQVSFVNGIWTSLGGTHVEYILNQIVSKVTALIKKEHKDLNIKKTQVTEYLNIYIDCVIEDPAFNSQTKETMTTKQAKFGSTCEIDDDFIKRLSKTDLIKEVIKIAQFKDDNKLSKVDGKRVSNLFRIPKLEDAKWAATKRSKETLLILTEGDSAKTLAITGLQVIGNERYGVFPLRGKLLNVRKATPDQILKNEEFIHLMQILGLKTKKVYNDISQLRYGGILILTDQDDDGFHIKGLIINMINKFWPSLMINDGFINSYGTPVVKAFKKSDSQKKNPKVFYSFAEYTNWVKDELQGDTSKWRIKYYKGLGTFDTVEGKSLFKDFENHFVKYVWEVAEKNKKSILDDSETKDTDENEEAEEDDEEVDYTMSKSSQSIDLAFNKNRADERKKWLMKYDSSNTLDHKQREVTYTEFINKELIHFSNADNIRSIPSIVDGLKPSQRKIFYACLKRGYRADELKVSQLGGYVAEHTEYHHGEQSLHSTIIGMAQNFPGSNNINLLQPNGAFGTRRKLGKDSASPRYIFTELNPLMAKLFRPEDDCLLTYQYEDGNQIEPVYYIPILPSVLINGTSGIGTGFSTKIPPHDPIDVADYILDLIDGKVPKSIYPHFRGFTGTVMQIGDYKYKITGKYEIIDQNTIRVTEIPITISTEAYKEFIMGLTIIDKKDSENEKKKIVSYSFKPSNNFIDATLQFKSNEVQKLIKKNDIEKYLKLSTTLSTSNYYLYNIDGRMTKYDLTVDILDEFYEFRLEQYKRRKAYRLRYLKNELDILEYKMKFINDKINKIIIIEEKKEEDIIKRLVELGYPKLSKNVDAHEHEKTYNYVRMNIFDLTKEKISELDAEYKAKQKEYEDYKNTTEELMWRREIVEFKEHYNKWLHNLTAMEQADDETDNDGKKNSRRKKTVTKIEKTPTKKAKK